MTDSALPLNANGVTLSLNELIAYKQQSIPWMPPAGNVWSSLSGRHQSRRLGKGMDFSEVRQYQAGDDVRSIDWRVTARTGKPHTKLFSEEKQSPVLVYIDFRKSMRFGSSLLLKSVQASHLAAMLCWVAVKQGDRVGAVINTGQKLIDLKPTGGNRGALKLIQQLVEQHNSLFTGAESKDVITNEEALQTLCQLCPKGSDLVLISDFLDISNAHSVWLHQLSQHNRVKMAHISDPLELGQTDYRGTEKVSNGESTRWFNFGSSSSRKRIKQEFTSHQNNLEQLAMDHAIAWASLSCGQTLIKQLNGMNNE